MYGWHAPSPTPPRPSAPSPRHPRRRTVLAAAGCCVLLGLGCSPGSAGEDGGEDPPAERAAEAEGEFWVDPDSPAARQVAQWERQGRAEDARALRRIADRPMAHWPSGERDPSPQVRAVTEAAGAEGRTALLVAYNIPHRDCGQYSRGGASGAETYRQWLGSFAEAIGDARTIVILEPDAVPHTADGCTAPVYVEERFALLAEAVERLKRQPNTRVYLDAGNPDWIEDPGRLARALERSGLEGADGFALNVANFQTTEASTEYGRELSELLGGAHFVIDTSRNGNGPYEGTDEPWCNPPGRALGAAPTAETGDPLVDAYLWIKRPGESDGECRGGPPPGQWWPEYALALARGEEEGSGE
ncbi:glycoside hydrolase family 6 protein [Streptomyces sp. DSM 44917]|uniref:Glucanase n=1 Tax=Streptomyces boetiae TaxID=3075541 RepID=A0ABU2L5Z3_9ACTN|nr:glycoside hydrolase family 6 protein [Streptomyces sp. DSM 44917]MDT0306976.1 glycoside hydrolase family 6 protein [Streptomyces sp. DSM 44917]